MIRPTLLLLILLHSVGALVPRDATAQDRGDRAARMHFQRAEKSFNLGKFDDALEAYEAAYEAKPLPGLLFNIAQCHRNLGNAERALFFFDRYLALDPASPNRALVEELLAEQRQKLEASKPAPEKPAASEPPAAIPPAPRSDATVISPPPARPSDAAPAFVSAPPRRSDDRGADQGAPIYKRWWFWTAAAVAVAGGVTAAFLLKRDPPEPPSTLDPITLP